MIRSFQPRDVSMTWTDLPIDKVVTPGVRTGIAEMDSISGMDVGVWEHTVGTSTDTGDDEIFVVIEGCGTVTDQHGNVIDLAPGVVGILHPEDETTWVITEALRKVWIVRAEGS
jgi:uncharacterized cupin superfamily protein